MKMVCMRILKNGWKISHLTIQSHNIDIMILVKTMQMHILNVIMGREVVIAITDGKLDFGPWEQIFYGEFDGQRNKKVLIKVIG